ncbi:MAG: hypothetical protein ACP5IL_04085 [Syntrophobacteraceae bacterium]
MDEASERAKLDLALEAREQFLKEHSGLVTFQDEIDRILEQAVGPEERMRALAREIEKNLRELNRLEVKLRSILELSFESLFQEAGPTLH